MINMSMKKMRFSFMKCFCRIKSVRRSLTLWLVLGLMFPALNSAAGNDEVLPLTLDRAIEIALSENPMIKIADREIERVDYSLRTAKNALLPSLNAEGNYSRNFKKQVMYLPDGIFGPGSGGAMEMGFDNSYTAGLTASLPLFSYSIYQNIRLTEHDVALAIESARASRVNMVSEVRKAYFGLLLAADSYRVMSQSMENAEKNLEDVRNLFNQGMVAEYDLIRSEVQVRNLRPSLLQARNGVRMAELMVRVLLGIDEAVVIVTEDDLESYNEGSLLQTNSAGMDLTNNPDLRQLNLEINRMHTQFQVVRAQRFPTLAAFGNFQYMTQANDFRFGNYQWANPIMAGLQLQIPIFNGFSVRNQEQQVSIGIEQMQMQMEYMDRNIQMQLQNAYNEMETAYDQIESNREGVRQAERGYVIAQTRYQTGSGTFLELNDAEMALTQAQLNLNQSLYNFLTAESEYRRIIGMDNVAIH